MKKIDIGKYKGPNANTRRIRTISRRLEKLHGPFVPKEKLDPVEELVLTLLSQATSDLNRDRAYKNLMETFHGWDDILNANVKTIEATIREGGLARNKSRALKKILKEVKDRYGGWNLGDIGTMPIDEAVEELSSLPGVGVKTAACVLVFAYHRPVIPVDTHVHRLSARLGLTTEKASAVHAYHVLMSIVPEELRYPFHLQIITHGRRVCKAQRPKCGECPLVDICPAAEIFE